MEGQVASEDLIAIGLVAADARAALAPEQDK